jgi:hypothetical protein
LLLPIEGEGTLNTKERIEEDLMPQKNNDGRDELNLAEFPLCALAHRLRPEQKTLRFEDRIWDQSRGEFITRQLIITGSDAFGLPTELDDEVLLALIQITRQRDFADRKVPFTRHELIRLLGWRDDSKNYHRLEASLNRWTGVTLYYNKAWWNNAKKCWMDEKFHILDNVWLCHRSEPPPDIGLDDSGARLSAFVWNEVIFRSFRAGNLKSIDFEFFKSLRNAVAKRLYRFLDKRFYHRKQWEFDLRELCFEHVGLSRNYDTANLKRKLLPGIRELEETGFLRPIPFVDQFRKLRAREWRVVFERAEQNKPTRRANKEKYSLARSLMERGVTGDAAKRSVQTYSSERIQTQIEIFDWLVKRNDPKVSKNPPGFLINSIATGYSAPSDFLSNNRTPECTPLHTRSSTPKVARDARQQEAEREIENFLQNLTAEEHQRLEYDALGHARDFERGLLKGDGALAAAARKCVLDAHVRKILRQTRSSRSE